MYLFFHSAQTRQYIQCLVCFTVLDLFYTKPVLVLCYWGTSYHRDRRSHSHMFFKIGVLKNFANFTGKHLGWCFILTKVVGQAFLRLVVALYFFSFDILFTKFTEFSVVLWKLSSSSWEIYHENVNSQKIHVICMWCVLRIGISHYLAFVWPFERIRMHANAFFTFLLFLSVFVSYYGFLTDLWNIKR